MTRKRASTPLGLREDGPGLPFDTPLKSSSTSASISLPLPDDGPPARKRSKNSESAVTTDTADQEDILFRLRAELNGAVLHDPYFFDRLSCDEARLDRILASCSLFDRGRGTWTEPSATGAEINFYRPTVDILNSIGEAVHSTLDNGPPYVPFLNQSNRKLKSSHDGMHTAPDLIKCDSIATNGRHIHWHDVDLFVEVKKQSNQATEGIQQSARYARALLAHRIDRMFVKTFVVCGTTAIFLHYDRSGLVYSDDIDMYTDAKRFIKAVAGLLLLRANEAGYNPMFETFWVSSNDQPTALSHRVSLNSAAYRVLIILCVRKCVRGRATLVLALRKIRGMLEPGIDADADADDDNDTIDAVLKLLWRDPTRFQERLILEQFVGVYGVCQLLFSTGEPSNVHPTVVYPRGGLVPGPRGSVFGRSNMNTDIPAAQRDDARELSLLLMQPGRPLSAARDVSELKAAFVGAIMGQWALVNSYVQHRDISMHNILLPYPNFQYRHPEWANPVRLEHNDNNFRVPDWLAIFNDPLAPRYTRVEELGWKFDPKRRFAMLRRVVAQLGPEPHGFLSDVDLANILSIARGNSSDMHTHRTGTLSFMAVELLLKEDDMPHSYLHDLESFFWVLLYIVAEHSESSDGPNDQAQAVLNDLKLIHLRALGHAKQSLLVRIARKKLDVKRFGTSWATDLAPTIQRFAAWIDSLSMLDFDGTVDPDACFEHVLDLFLTSMSGQEPLSHIESGPEAHGHSTLKTVISPMQETCTCTANCHHNCGDPEKRRV